MIWLKKCKANSLIWTSNNKNEDLTKYCDICQISFKSEFEGEEISQLELIDDYQEKTLNLSNNTMNMLFKFSEEILKSDSYSIQDLNDILKLIQEYIEKIWGTTNHIEILNLQVFEGAYQLLKYLHRSINEINEKLNEWLLKEQKKHNVDSLFQLLSNVDIFHNENNQMNCELRQSKQFQISTFNNRQYLLNSRINETNTLWFVSYDKYPQYIQLHGFNSFNKLIQKKSSQNGFFWLNQLLFSESDNPSQIKIWQNLQNQQMLRLQTRQRYNYIVPYNQDGFVLANDNQIVFWKKNKKSWKPSFILIIEALENVYGLCFNPAQTKLVSQGSEGCENTDNIFIIELIDEQWTITQNIKVESIWNVVHFTSNNQFVFQTSHLGFFEVFNYDDNAKQFIRTKPFYFSNKIYGWGVKYHPVDGTNIIIVNQGGIFLYIQFDQNCQHKILKSIKFDQTREEINVSSNGKYITIVNVNQVQVLRLRNMQ